MITRDFTGSGFGVSDWTEELNIIPNQWGTINSLGIFAEEGVAEHVIQFDEVIKDGALIVDRIRGERANVGRDYKRKIHSFNVPHFPMEDAIYPQDIQGKRAYGSPTEAETFDAVRGRKLERIRQNHAWTLEAARAQAIVLGTVYAPNLTVVQDWYQEFTQTTRPTTIDFLFGTSTTDVMGKIEANIAAIQDNSGSVTITGIVALCGPTFFQRLITHATVKTAYQYYAATNQAGNAQPLRDRMATGVNAPQHRMFNFGGALFIEMRDKYAGTALIGAADCYFLPTGTEFFKTYFSPANRFGLVNTVGEQVYVFESMEMNGTAYKLESESNHISALLKPLLVSASTSST